MKIQEFTKLRKSTDGQMARRTDNRQTENIDTLPLFRSVKKKHAF